MGKATVTLQDVAILRGLWYGQPVTSHPKHVGEPPVTLGLTLDGRSIDRAGLRLRLLREHFGVGPPPDATATSCSSTTGRIFWS